MDAKEDREAFLERWSRLKREAGAAARPEAGAPSAGASAQSVQLPALDTLDFDSDYRAFFGPGVEETVRRAALKKLFSAPHFNVMDGLDVYIEDYSRSEPLPAALLAGLRQAQRILEWARGAERERERLEGPREPPQELLSGPSEAAGARPAESQGSAARTAPREDSGGA